MGRYYSIAHTLAFTETPNTASFVRPIRNVLYRVCVCSAYLRRRTENWLQASRQAAYVLTARSYSDPRRYIASFDRRDREVHGHCMWPDDVKRDMAANIARSARTKNPSELSCPQL